MQPTVALQAWHPRPTSPKRKKARRPDGHGKIVIRTTSAGNTVQITIQDNGCGIPDSVIEKIFDPFFTTKEIGKGTGQGLAIARAVVVDKHHGKLDVKSQVGQGTTFTITLPIDGVMEAPTGLHSVLAVG